MLKKTSNLAIFVLLVGVIVWGIGWINRQVGDTITTAATNKFHTPIDEKRKESEEELHTNASDRVDQILNESTTTPEEDFKKHEKAQKLLGEYERQKNMYHVPENRDDKPALMAAPTGNIVDSETNFDEITLSGKIAPKDSWVKAYLAPDHPVRIRLHCTGGTIYHPPDEPSNSCNGYKGLSRLSTVEPEDYLVGKDANVNFKAFSYRINGGKAFQAGEDVVIDLKAWDKLELGVNVRQKSKTEASGFRAYTGTVEAK